MFCHLLSQVCAVLSHCWLDSVNPGQLFVHYSFISKEIWSFILKAFKIAACHKWMDTSLLSGCYVLLICCGIYWTVHHLHYLHGWHFHYVTAGYSILLATVNAFFQHVINPGSDQNIVTWSTADNRVNIRYTRIYLPLYKYEFFKDKSSTTTNKKFVNWINTAGK